MVSVCMNLSLLLMMPPSYRDCLDVCAIVARRGARLRGSLIANSDGGCSIVPGGLHLNHSSRGEGQGGLHLNHSSRGQG